MTWTIAGLLLPIDPSSVRRRIARKQTVDKLVEKMPFAIDTGPDMFELTVTGLIWPEYKAFALWEIVKGAELPTVDIVISPDDIHFQQYNGRYAINRAESGVDGPRFTADPATIDGTTVVHDYNINFVQFADQGVLADSDSADPILDEDGVGFADFDINFDTIDFLTTINIAGI